MKKLFLLLTIGPCIISYLHLYNVLSWYTCRIYRSGSNVGGSSGGIQCSSNNVVVLSISTSTSTTTTTTTRPSSRHYKRQSIRNN
mmetsp:Transcript_11751/g.28137  ORF Transcript_11751/g.28137 Transcript_11751/m.28137 type:complete len:85 (+) Transcript_11751:118-372(+)